MSDGFCQRLLEEAIMKPLFRKNLNLRTQYVLVLNNGESQDVLGSVDPRYGMIPWNELLEGRISKGDALC